MRTELLQKFGEKKKDGSLVVNDEGMIEMNPSKSAEFVAAHNDLLSIDVDIEAGLKISLEDLGNIELSVQDLVVLEDFISE